MADKHERLKELKIERADIESAGSGGRFTLLVLAFILLLVAGGGYWWYSQTRALAVETATVRQISSQASNSGSTVLDASGYVTARRQATVSSKITGKIINVEIEEGMEVAEGQELARLDDSIPRRQLALSEAQLAAAKSRLAETEVILAERRLQLGRTRALVDAEVRSQADLDAIQAEVDSLVARLGATREDVTVAERSAELRRQEIEDYVIRAPFHGIVVTKNAQPGEMISPVSAGGGFTRTGIGTVVDMNSLEIEVDVNESYINRVSPGQPVVAVLDAYPNWQIPASVITPVPTADRQKATVRVRIGFEKLGDPRLLPDMGVKVSFLEEKAPATTTAAAAPPRFEIPAAALQKDGERSIVFIISGETVERRAVEIVERQGDRAILAAGVRGGEQVVIAPPEGLADGDPVRIVNQEEKP